MFERFTNSARQIVVQAQAQARQFGHGFIGREHLLLALVSLDGSAAVVLQDQGLTPERTRAEVVRMVGPGRTVSLLAGLDREALASIGIDLDAVRSRIEATFGPDALAIRARSRCPAEAPPASGPERAPGAVTGRAVPGSGFCATRPHPVHPAGQEGSGALAT